MSILLNSCTEGCHLKSRLRKYANWLLIPIKALVKQVAEKIEPIFEIVSLSESGENLQ